MSKEEEAKNLFKERGDHFVKKTLEIFDLLEEGISAVVDYIVTNDGEYSGGMLVWDDISLEHENVYLIGMYEFKPGSTVVINNKEIEITEDNVDSYTKIFHVALPLNILASCDYDKITDYLNNNLYFKSEFDVMEQFENNKADNDFDLSELTEEQRKSFMTFNNVVKGKN